MKLMAGSMLFLLCALMGEGRARRLKRREQALGGLSDLIQAVSERQVGDLVPFREGLLSCPPSPAQEMLLRLLGGEETTPLLTAEEKARILTYARSESRSVGALRGERDALLAFLRKERDRTHQEIGHKGQVYRSVGYLCGAAALLLVL